MIDTEAIFVPRSYAEKTTDLMQIVPYVIFHNSLGQWFAYRRTDKSGEPRLVGMISFGVGGHITLKEDGPSKTDILLRGRDRELSEEVSGSWLEPRPIAVINDRDFEVSRHHLGIVYSTVSEDLEIKEKDVLEGGFMSVAEIRTGVQPENWSNLILYKYIVE